MSNILTSRKLSLMLILGNFILVTGFIGFKIQKNFLEQTVNQLLSRRDQLRENIRLWEKFGAQLIVSSPTHSDSISKEIRSVVKQYPLNSAIFAETKTGFDLKLDAQTDWDIYVVTYVLQKQLNGRYILSGFQVSRSPEAEGISAILQWIK